MRPYFQESAAEFEKLSHGDLRIAQEFFNRVWKDVEEPLWRRLRGQGLPPERCHDLVQTTSTRLWDARLTLNVPSEAAWWRLACRVCRNVTIDEYRKDAGWTTSELSDTIPDADGPYLDVLLDLAVDRERLYALADKVWLGGDEDALAPCLLAAQLFYLNELEPATIARLLDVDPVETIERWLIDPTVVLRLAFDELYLGNDALAGYMLRPSNPVPPREIDRLMESANRNEGVPLPGWEWDELLLLLWRIRNGLLTDQILRFSRCRCSRAELEAKFQAWARRYPFFARATKLRSRFALSGATKTVQEIGLWRRLVFQYHVRDDLAYRQILERVEPAATPFDVRVTEAMLTGWIGMGRLFVQLAVAAQEETE